MSDRVSVSRCRETGPRGEHQVTLAEAWNGVSWTILKTPNPGDGILYELNWISRPSSADCFAVGDYVPSPNGGTTVALAERWNGARWSVQKTACPRHSQALELDGISCVSARAYVAVGSYFRGRNDGLTLAERFNGIRWTVQHTPHPAGGQDNELDGVSCASATRCVAVGNDESRAGRDVPLAERYS